MQSIKTNNSIVHFGKKCYTALNTYLKDANFSKIFVLVDENTHRYCLPRFLQFVETNTPIEILEIESGEPNKNIDTCSGLWSVLSELGADRKALIMNLGGGVITDLGGFVASTYKRGIQYINVPTTLLAMVDASVGGKTGVDLGALKNQIGVINSGDMVLIDTVFLETLSKEQRHSGVAEMLKHGLINGEDYWLKMQNIDKAVQTLSIDQLIYESVLIKNDVVTKDPKERNLRKTLNFGHTLGHAIESYFLEHKEKTSLLHGEAIAIGMILECFISKELLGFPEKKLEELIGIVKSLFTSVSINSTDYTEIIELLKFDKKNEHGNINFVLLNDIGDHKINCQVENNLIISAFDYYTKIMK